VGVLWLQTVLSMLHDCHCQGIEAPWVLPAVRPGQQLLQVRAMGPAFNKARPNTHRSLYAISACLYAVV